MLEAVLTGVVLLLLLSGVLWAGGGKTTREAHGSGIIERMPDAFDYTPAVSDTLLVFAYCLTYGLDPTDQGRHGRAPAQVYDRLDQVIEAIAASGADLALLQEVDFASRRTSHIDQLQYIATALGWGFAARVITWECRYLPVPFWPLHRQPGRIRAGMGVISRYPLVQNMRQRLPQTATHPLLTPLFAPYPMVQMVDIQCGGRTMRVLNLHCAAQQSSMRHAQAQVLVPFIRQVATPHCVLVGATDLQDRASASPVLTTLATQLQDRLRLVEASVPLCIGPGLQVVEAHREAPLAGKTPALVRLRWALPLRTAPQNGDHAP